MIKMPETVYTFHLFNSLVAASQAICKKVDLRNLQLINTYTAKPVCWREWISWQLL